MVMVVAQYIILAGSIIDEEISFRIGKCRLWANSLKELVTTKQELC